MTVLLAQAGTEDGRPPTLNARDGSGFLDKHLRATVGRLDNSAGILLWGEGLQARRRGEAYSRCSQRWPGH